MVSKRDMRRWAGRISGDSHTANDSSSWYSSSYWLIRVVIWIHRIVHIKLKGSFNSVSSIARRAQPSQSYWVKVTQSGDMQKQHFVYHFYIFNEKPVPFSKREALYFTSIIRHCTHTRTQFLIIIFTLPILHSHLLHIHHSCGTLWPCYFCTIRATTQAFWHVRNGQRWIISPIQMKPQLPYIHFVSLLGGHADCVSSQVWHMLSFSCME